MKMLSAAAVAFAIVTGSGAASAATFSQLSDFASYSADQGLGSCKYAGGLPVNCQAVDNNRDDLDRAFAGGGANSGFYSMGIGGTATFGTAPLGITSGSVLEVTFNVGSQGDDTGYPEAARVYLGTADDKFAVLLGSITNYGDTTGSITASLFDGDSWQFLISVGDNLGYQYLTFADATFEFFGSEYTNKYSDGFDLDGLEVTAVPEPATLALVGAGILGFGLLRRRNAA